MKKQYIVQKYVMADSVTEAIKKSKRLPIHECYVNSGWFDKVANFQFSNNKESRKLGFNSKK